MHTQTNNISHVTAENNSSIINNNGAKFDKLEIIFKEPSMQPIFSLKHYNFNDPYLIGYLAVYSLFALISIFYPMPLYAILIFFTTLFLPFARIIQIMEVVHVYNHFFSYNGKLIRFSVVKKLEEKGHRLKIEFIDEIENSDLPKEIVFIKKEELAMFKKQYNISKEALRFLKDQL